MIDELPRHGPVDLAQTFGNAGLLAGGALPVQRKRQAGKSVRRQDDHREACENEGNRGNARRPEAL
jgi:hypothetical protein